VLVYALADYSVSLGIRCHVKNDDYFITRCELTERIKLAFDEAGISIPSPAAPVNVVLPSTDGARDGLFARGEEAAPDRARTESDEARQRRQDRHEKVEIGDAGHRPKSDPE
jgi:small conductance mechanosensitive channel